MRLGILGTGMIVNDVLTMYDQLNVEKTVIFATERSKAKAEELVGKYNLDGYYTDYDELLESDIDTVYVALPNFLHYTFAKKALLKGKHAIIEKPITCNAKELEELMEIAEEKGCMIFEALNIHYLPAYLSLKEDVEKLGDIKIIHANYSQYSSRYDAFKRGEILPAFDYHKAGGAMMDINVYNIQAVMGIFGTPEKAEYHPNIENNIDTSGMMVFDYDGFKAVCIGAKDCAAPGQFTIQGNKGVIVTGDSANQLTQYEIRMYGEEPIVKTFENKTHRLYPEFKEFVRMVDEKDTEKAKKMLQTAYEVSKVMEQARIEKGIVFDNDMN